MDCKWYLYYYLKVKCSAIRRGEENSISEKDGRSWDEKDRVRWTRTSVERKVKINGIGERIVKRIGKIKNR